MSSTMPSREHYLATLEPTKVADLPQSTADDLKCYICFGKLSDEPNEDEERPVLLHGVHQFGETCIRNWLATNNNCPFCRQTVLCDHYHMLIARLRAVAQGIRTTRSPVNDCEVLKLAQEAHSTRFSAPAAAAQTVKDMVQDLMHARNTLYRNNPNMLSSNEYYTLPSPQQPMRLGQELRVDAARHRESATIAFNQRFWQGVDDSVYGRPVHVATHPLADRAFRIIQHILNRLDGQLMTAIELRTTLRDAIESDKPFQHIVPAALFTFYTGMISETVASAVAQFKASSNEDAKMV